MQLEIFLTSKMIRLFVIVLFAVGVTSQNVPGIRLRSLVRATTTTATTCGTGLRFACSDCTTQLVIFFLNIKIN